MMKVYGAQICVDCRNYKALQEKRGFEAEYIEITKDTGKLKEFLHMRDTDPVFDPAKEHGGIGIPFFVHEDGRKTFDVNEALSWIGQEPVSEEEKEWLKKYDALKDRLVCKVDLDAYFTEKNIGNVNVDQMAIGNVHFPTGKILACDPLVELGDARPYIQTVPAGTYPVTVCVVPSEAYGDRYAAVKVTICDTKPVRYVMGMTGNENLDEEIGDDEFFGFFVDAGMGCIGDLKTQEAFREYWAKREVEEEGIDPYNDLFSDLLEESFNTNPKYQREGGDWVNWTVPGTDCNLPVFTSGWGDGVYPVYFGYDAEGKVCAVYIHFIHIENEYEA